MNRNKLGAILLRPEYTLSALIDMVPQLHDMVDKLTIGTNPTEVIEETEIRCKYEGYIHREKMAADKLHRLDTIKLAENFDYNSIQSLSTEARQKLTKIRPVTIGQASRIPGVSPNDISVLLVLLGR